MGNRAGPRFLGGSACRGLFGPLRHDAVRAARASAKNLPPAPQRPASRGNDLISSYVLSLRQHHHALLQRGLGLEGPRSRRCAISTIARGNSSSSIPAPADGPPGFDPSLQSDAFHPDSTSRIQSRPCHEPWHFPGKIPLVFLSERGCYPQNANWLGTLFVELSQPEVAAVFGRQIPREDCQAVFACDYERCFGKSRQSARWDHFFSMVSSGLNRNIWAQRGFREDLQYAEDDEYTRWCRAQGHEVRYVPQSIVRHSHNYTAAQAQRRSFGDAKAIGQAWTGNPRVFNLPRTVLLGWMSDVRHDFKFCLRHRRLMELPQALPHPLRPGDGRFSRASARATRIEPRSFPKKLLPPATCCFS